MQQMTANPLRVATALTTNKSSIIAVTGIIGDYRKEVVTMKSGGFRDLVTIVIFDEPEPGIVISTQFQLFN